MARMNRINSLELVLGQSHDERCKQKAFLIYG